MRCLLIQIAIKTGSTVVTIVVTSMLLRAAVLGPLHVFAFRIYVLGMVTIKRVVSLMRSNHAAILIIGV